MIRHKFNYFKKRLIMSTNEYRFYKILDSFVDPKYMIIPQVHLDELIKPSGGVKKTTYLFSFRYINQKSVDFVICEKESMKPLIAIELDDSSHLKEERKNRDEQVNKLLTECHIPLLRFPNKRQFAIENIKKQILENLK